MKAETLQLQQGTAEWAAHRARHYNASEAAAMLGLSPYKTRAELLREKATGITPEVDAATQRRFDRGHEIEALARPIAERIIGSELYPVVLSAEVDGLPLSASLDGLTMLETEAFECKTLNANLAEALSYALIPDEYHPQMEQGLLLSGADRCLFMASDGTEEGTLWAWYESRPAVRAKLLYGWKQFADDLANYQHVETAAEVVVEVLEGLPTPVIQVEGRVVSSNMGAFKLAAAKFMDNLPNAQVLETDQDFANADMAVKACKEAEERLATVKAQAQAQAADIDEVFRSMDAIAERIRAARLALDKAVMKRKDDIRAGLVMQANKDLAEHRQKLNARLGGDWMPVIDGGFAAAIKGKKTLTGLRDALDTAIANAKISANEIADTIEINRNHYASQYASAAWLAPDFKAICAKSAEDFANLLARRAAEHDEAVRKQEADLLMREQQVAEQDQRGKVEVAKSDPEVRIGQDQVGEKASTQPDNRARMKLGDINARLGFTLTADFLSRLGFDPVGHERAAKLYRECDFQAICHGIARHVQSVPNVCHTCRQDAAQRQEPD